MGPSSAQAAALVPYRERVGETFLFRTTGDAARPAWGTDVYSDDSDLASAAVHAGLLKAGETGVVKLLVVRAAGPFEGSVRNGATTGAKADWPGGAFRLEKP